MLDMSSDDLYTTEDSDVDSFSDELSPADGYFNSNLGAIGMPGLMVQDPSLDLDNKKPEDKVLIPTPNSRTPLIDGSRDSSHSAITQSSSSRTDASHPPSESMLSSPPPRHAQTPLSRISSQHNHAVFSEHTPFMGGPPPAYTPRLSNPSRASATPRSEIQYPILGENRLEQGFLRPHSPESMGGPVDDEPDERAPLSDNTPRPSPRRVVTRHVLLFAVIFMAICSFIPFFYVKFRRHKNPVAEFPISDGEPPPFVTRPYCPSAKFKNDQVVYEFPVGSGLTVIQTSHDNSGHRFMSYVKPEGEITLRRLPKDSEYGNQAHITVDVRVSDPKIQVIKAWDVHTRTLEISTPRSVRLDPSTQSCVSMEVTLWFPGDAVFTDLLIKGSSLNLKVLEDVKINVSGLSKFSTSEGDVFFPTIGDLQAVGKNVAGTEPAKILNGPSALGQSLLSSRSTTEAAHSFSSRQIVVETTTGSINGDYPLLDYLALSSSTGDIKVGVFPEEALSSAPAPADLEVQTATGTILISLPLADEKYAPPPRDYVTNVHSFAGSIGGEFYIGSVASFKSNSGKLSFKALPIIQANASENSRDTGMFETHTITGSIDLEVLEPLYIFLPESTEDQPLQKRESHSDPPSPAEGENPYPDTLPNANQSTPIPDSSEQDKPKKLRNLHSKHSSNSGAVTVVYPKIWEGSVYATSVSGDITLKGSGLRTIKEKKGWAYNQLLARKGVENKKEGCVVEMSNISGDLKLLLE